MEIASDELITDEEREKSQQALKSCCAEACQSVSAQEAGLTAKAVYHDAVTAAAKDLASSLCDEAVPIAREVVEKLLKDSSQHPFVEEAVLCATKPVARDEALTQIRNWSQEKALPRAEAAARKVFDEYLPNGSQQHLHTAAMAAIRVLIQNQINKDPQTSSAQRAKIIDDYLSSEGLSTAREYFQKSISPELRRKAQAAAQLAVEEIASQANDAVARESVVEAARKVADYTAKAEVSRLILAEAQRRAAKLARERLQDAVQEIEEDQRLEFCIGQAAKIADEAVQGVSQEIAAPEAAELDVEKARELALSAATAVAREFAGCYQLDCEYQGASQVSKKTIAFLVMQILLGCSIVWFFLLGGFECCQPFLKSVLPAGIYEAIYKSVPAINKNVQEENLDDLLDEDASTLPAVPETNKSPAEDPEGTQKKLPASGPEALKENEMPPDLVNSDSKH